MIQTGATFDLCDCSPPLFREAIRGRGTPQSGVEGAQLRRPPPSQRFALRRLPRVAAEERRRLQRGSP